MSLHDLPPELTATVIEYLAQQEPACLQHSISFKPHISQYASISLSIQCAVEQHLFTRLTITSDELPTFEELVAQSPKRRGLLRTLDFTPLLPEYDEIACSRFERPSDQQANNDALTAAVSTLYTSLRDCHKMSSIRVNTPYSPTDSCNNRRARYADNRLDYMLGKKVDIWERRYAQSLLSIRASLDMPLLDQVTTFSMSGDYQRYVAPHSAVTLVRHHPRLEVVKLRLDDNEKTRPELRVQLRTDFARDLLMTPCTAMKHFLLSYRYEDPTDQRFTNVDVRGAREDCPDDAFSTSLRRFLIAAPDLELVNLSGPICIDESFFEPSDSHSLKRQWHALRELHIEMSAVRPDGGWYLDEDADIPRDEPSRQTPRTFDETDDDDVDLTSDSESSAFSDDSFFAPGELQPDDFDPHRDALKTGDAYSLSFRFRPNAAFERVLEAAARFASLNEITDMSLRMGVNGCPGTDQRAEMFELELRPKASPGNTSPCSTLYLRVHREWQMSDTLAELLKTRLGLGAVITYETW
jgi:hypothetical protein